MNPVIKTAIAIVGTQKELAKACGVSQAAVQKWLHGKAKVAPQNVASLVDATGGVSDSTRPSRLVPKSGKSRLVTLLFKNQPLRS